MKISPTSKIILEAIKSITSKKLSLVKLNKSRFDPQFISLLGVYGITDHIKEEIDYLEDLDLIESVDIKDNYMGNPTHYILTKRGIKLLGG